MGRLFRNIGWSFLVDSVRVRPLHEEMTAGLLQEFEKRRAQKTSRGSTSRDPSGFASAVLAATAANATGGDEAATTAGTTSERPSFGARMTTAIGAAPTRGSPTTPTAATTTVGSHPPRAVTPTDKSSEVESITDAVPGAADRIPSVEEGREVAHAGGEAAVAVKRRVEADRRRAALATIEQHRSHRHNVHAAAGAANAVVTTGGSATPSQGSVQEGAQEHGAATRSVATMSTTRAVSCTSSHVAGAGAGNPSLSMSTAFSRQSVRSGETLGYYGREEVSVLSAISKNPSRIAAYNRITEGKTGQREDGPSPEVRRKWVWVGCRDREERTWGASSGHGGGDA